MSDSPDLRAIVRRAYWRAGLLGFGWYALLEGDHAGLAFGVPVVIAATIASLMLCPREAPATHLRPVESARLASSFAVGSLRGGLDVALRALSPRVSLSPAVVPYATELTPGPTHRLFTSLVTLMPGTLSIQAEARRVRVHVLVDREAIDQDLATLERRVATAVWTTPLEEGALP